MERVEIIKQKLLGLKKWDAALTFFGASTHQYKLNSCMTKHEIKGFEDNNQATLPEEYHCFLLNVCNGLAGPNYGLFSLGSLSLFSTLRVPFPHSQTWNIESKVPQTVEEEEEYAETYFANDLINGSLRISSAGCYEILLIVSGAEKGSIWCDDRDSDNGIYPIASSFFDWYESWLDENLKKCPEFWITPPSFAK